MTPVHAPYELADGLWVLPGSVNSYLVVEGGAALAIDTGWHRDGPRLLDLVRRTTGSPRGLTAILLTHGHPDHCGSATWLAQETGAPILAAPEEAPVLADPLRGNRTERSPVLALLRPRGWSLAAELVRGGALRTAPVHTWTPVSEDAPLEELPGRPEVLATPGHTPGHLCIALPQHDAVATGDLLVTTDPYTLRTGPRLISPAATADRALARASLDRLVDRRERLVLPGHGPIWDDGASRAVTEALQR